jgi:cardiolipin synthase A/B
MWTTPLPAVLSLLIYAVAAMTALRAIATSRTPQGAVGWAIFIIALPFVAVPLYFVLGNASYRSYIVARRASDAAVMHRAAPRRQGGEPDPHNDADGPRSGRIAVFERLAAIAARGGNGIDLLIDGAETTASLHHAIDQARDYLLVQYYIIRADEAGHRLKDALIAKAREGVEVCLLYNAFQGFGLPRAFLKELRDAGVKVHVLRGPRRPLGRFQVNFRNHRKVVVVDGRIGFTGGLNIGEEYLGRDPVMGKWRDTHVRLVGPLVTQLQDVFIADWHWTAREDLTERVNRVAERDPRNVRALLLACGPSDVHPTGNLYFCAAANAAQDRLWIATPYCVPDIEVLSTIKLAAIRGADVRILVPDKPDHYLPWLAAFAYFDELRAAGVTIWRYEAGFMHQKVLLIDDDIASIGTINLDVRSGILNYEETVIIDDIGFANGVREMLEMDFARARKFDAPLAQQSLWLRIAAPLARLLAPLL